MLGELKNCTPKELNEVTRAILARVRAQGKMSAFDETELLQVGKEIETREECARLAHDSYHD